MFRNVDHIVTQLVFRLVDTGRIQEYDLSLFQGQYRLNTVTGGLRFVRCDGDLLSDQSVHQSGLTYVGTSDQCGKAGFVDSLKNIGEGLKEAAIWFVIHIPYLVIWAIVIAIIILILKKIKKRTKRIRAEEQKRKAEEEAKKQKTQVNVAGTDESAASEAPKK